MNKILILLIALSSVFSAAYAQQTSTTALTDSTAYVSETDSTVVHQLEEFVVEGRSALVGKEGIVFMPNSTEVKHADDAYSLIENMGIPFLRSTGANFISTIVANPEVFIDYNRASQTELFALRPKDVLVVEFLLFPADVRFQGAKAVLNFVLKPKEEGGYVKAQASQGFFHSVGMYSLYGKYVKGNWSFDLSSSFFYSDYNSETISETTYSGFDRLSPENYPEITRTHVQNEKTKLHTSKSGFRFKYTSSDFMISNTLSFDYSRIPKIVDNGYISYSPEIYPATLSNTSLNAEKITPEWDMEMYIRANDKLSFSIYTIMDYEHFLRHNRLSSDEFETIKNDIKSDSYNEQLSFYTNYRLNPNNSFSFNLGGSAWQYKTIYGGSVVANPKQRVRSEGVSSGFGWTHERENGMRLNLGAYADYIHSAVNGKGYCSWVPRTNLNLYYPLDGKQFISLTGNYRTLAPGSNSQFDALWQVNEILWSTFDAERKTGYAYDFNLGYSNNLTNKFSFSVSANYDQRSSMKAYHYTVVDAYKILRSNDFNGKYRSVSVNLSGTLKLFDNSWHISGYCDYDYSQFFGSLNKIYQKLYASIDTRYFIKDFSFSASFSTPHYSTSRSAEVYETSDCNYGIGCRYSHHNLDIQVSANNIFRKKAYTSTYYVTDNYSSVTKKSALDMYSAPSRAITVKVTYTLDFGSKVNKWDEIR